MFCQKTISERMNLILILAGPYYKQSKYGVYFVLALAFRITELIHFSQVLITFLKAHQIFEKWFEMNRHGTLAHLMGPY